MILSQKPTSFRVPRRIPRGFHKPFLSWDVSQCERTTSKRCRFYTDVDYLSFYMSLSTRKWFGNRYAGDIRRRIDIVSISSYFPFSLGLRRRLCCMIASFTDVKYNLSQYRCRVFTACALTHGRGDKNLCNTLYKLSVIGT